MRIDDNTGNFIGKGEDPTVSLLIHVLNLKEKKTKDFKNKKQGIYRQISLLDLLHPNYIENLAQDHRRGSVDIVLVIKKEIYAIRVQGDGHYGDIKSRKDALQKFMLQQSGINVIDIWKHECKELFTKDRLTQKSAIEIIQSFEYQAHELITKKAKKKILTIIKS